MLTKNQILDAIKRTLVSYKTNILDKEYSTIQYVDDSIKSLEDTNKYKLITCDDPLVINKTDITGIADATVTIDNLTGQYGNLTANEDGTWTYTLNGFMNGLETFTFTVGEITQDLVIVPYKEMLYNDNNSNISYNDDNWISEENENSYNNSIHKKIDKDVISTFNILFYGTNIDILGILPNNNELGKSKLTLSIYKGNNNNTENRIYLSTNDLTLYNYNTEYNSKLTFSNNIDLKEYGIYNCKGAIPKNNNIFIDSVIIYNPLGNIINGNILKLYNIYEFSKKNNLLFTDKANYKFEPTKLYDPATKKFVDDSIKALEDTEEETLNKLLEYGLISDALMLENGTYLADENNKLLQF